MSDNPDRCSLALPIDDPALTNRPTESELLELLEPLVDWHIVAIHLLPSGSSSIRQRIKTENQSISEQKIALFDEWFKTDPSPTWKKLVTALAKAKENALALNVATSVIRGLADKESIETAPKGLTQRETDVKPLEEERDTQRTVATDDVPLTKQSTQQQVTINISSERQVKDSIVNLHRKFTLLVRNVRTQLEASTDTEKKLRLLARHVEEYLSETNLTKVADIDELFNKIQPHYSFLNCDLIEDIIREFLLTEDDLQVSLNQYLKELDQFEQSSPLRFIKVSIEEALLPKQGVTESTCEVVIKLHERWGPIPLRNFKNVIEYIFPDKSNLLSHIHIERGSICIRYLAPLSQLQFLVENASTKIEFMVQIGIIEMYISDQHIVSPIDESSIDLNESMLDAAEAGDMFAVSVLLMLGTDVNYQDEEKWSALMFASENGHYQIVELLLKAYAELVNAQNQEGATALMYASINGHYQTVELLLKAYADVNFQNHDGVTALMFASNNGHYQIAEMLLKAYAEVNVQNQDGGTALKYASENGHYKVVELLLNAHADVNVRTQKGSTALIFASNNGHYQIAELLLKAHADANIQNQDGGTALMYASINGHYQTVELLLEAYADVNVQTPLRATALMFASKKGHYQIVELLLKAHADVNIPDKYGYTALMMASDKGHHEIVELLEKGNITAAAVSPPVNSTSINTAVPSVSQRTLRAIQYPFSSFTKSKKNTEETPNNDEPVPSSNIISQGIRSSEPIQLKRHQRPRQLLKLFSRSATINDPPVMYPQ